MHIKKAGRNHLSWLVAINKIIDYDNPDEFILESIEWGRVFVALSDKRVIGYLLYQVIWGNTPFLALLKILPDFQGQWLGTKFIHVFEEEVSELWYKSYISSTGVENTGSKIFHEKKWFSQIGTLDMPFGGEVFFKKEL